MWYFSKTEGLPRMRQQDTGEVSTKTVFTEQAQQFFQKSL